MDNTPIASTKVFPAETLVRIHIRADDPERTPTWKVDIGSDATYEGAEYGGTANHVDDDCFSVVIPQADLRKWELASTSNGADIEVDPTPMEGSVALPKLTYH